MIKVKSAWTITRTFAKAKTANGKIPVKTASRRSSKSPKIRAFLKTRTAFIAAKMTVVKFIKTKTVHGGRRKAKMVRKAKTVKKAMTGRMAVMVGMLRVKITAGY